MNHWLRSLGLSSLAALTGLLATAPSAEAQNAHRWHGPPPAAFEACKEKKSGDACKFEARERKLEGTCGAAPKAQDKLVCIPAKLKQMREAAMKACEAKKDGDACSVETPKGKRDGTCRKTPHSGDKLMCAPKRPKD